MNTEPISTSVIDNTELTHGTWRLQDKKELTNLKIMAIILGIFAALAIIGAALTISSPISLPIGLAIAGICFATKCLKIYRKKIIPREKALQPHINMMKIA